MFKRTPKPERQKGRSTSLWVRLAAAAVWAFVAIIAVIAFYAYDLPDVDKALDATRRPTVTLQARDGGHLITVGDIHGLPVKLNDVPPSLVQAVMATEDRRFYSHFGLDLIGLARATVANVKAGRIVQGGSTLTQQVAKNLFLTPERTLKRKIQELMLALWLEHKFSKDQILTVYLNRVYLGSGAYGVEAASRRYFRKSARHINTYEAAMLAGLLKAPSRYNPSRNPELAGKRTAQVLKNMVAAGYISSSDAEKVRTEQTSIRPVRTSRRSRYFSDWVLELTPSYVSPSDRDIIVVTTLDRRLQADAEAAMARAFKDGASVNAKQGALVAMAPDGAVRAMIGGADYGISQFNRATQANRQPGSAFKPIVYLAGLEAGLSPATQLIDEPLTIDGWSPRNFSREFKGQMTLKESLAQSVNTIAVSVSEKVGRKTVIDTAKRLGVTSALKADPSLALGASGVKLIDLTAAYGTFANGGYGIWPYAIEEIRDQGGRILYKRQGSGPGRTVKARDAAAMNNMLAAAVSKGTGKAARMKRPVAGKTGTSQNFRDAWFIGYSADLVAGVWMGNDNGQSMKGVTGGGLPARAWRRFMASAHRKTPHHALLGVDGKGGGELPRVATRQKPVQKTSPKPVQKKDVSEKPFWQSIVEAITGPSRQDGQ